MSAQEPKAGLPDARVRQEAQQTLTTWAEKNHHGRAWKTGCRRRWFVMHGFHVRYYADEKIAGQVNLPLLHYYTTTLPHHYTTTPQQCGAFDLRNVRVLHNSFDPSAPAGAIDVVLSEKKGGSSQKVVTVALPAEEKERWLRHMCSAASDDALPPAMRDFRSAELATALDDSFATQTTASSTYGATRAPRTPRTRSSSLPNVALTVASASSVRQGDHRHPASRRMSASGLFCRLSLNSMSSHSSAGSTPWQSRQASVASRSSDSDESAEAEASRNTADNLSRTESWMYAEDIPTWLPPAARRCSDPNGTPEPQRPSSSHSALLEQIHKHASGRLEEGSTSRRRSLGGPASPDRGGPASPERVSTIPFPARGNSIPAASRKGLGDFSTVPIPAFDEAAKAMIEAPAPSFSAAAAAQWTCGACRTGAFSMRNNAISIRCTACDALRGCALAAEL